MKYILIGVEDRQFDEVMRQVMPVATAAMTGPGNGTVLSGSAASLLPHVQRAAAAESDA